jgi:hypothetical protein
MRVALPRQILRLPKTPDHQGSRLASYFLSNSASSTSYHKTDPPLSVYESSRLCPARLGETMVNQGLSVTDGRYGFRFKLSIFSNYRYPWLGVF